MSDTALSIVQQVRSESAKQPPTVAVRTGDSLWKIVDRSYEIRDNAHRQSLIDTVVRTNGLRDPNHIEPGWILVMPPPPTSSAPPTAPPAEVQSIREANDLLSSLPAEDREAVAVLHEMFKPRSSPEQQPTSDLLGGPYMPNSLNLFDAALQSTEQTIKMNKGVLQSMASNYETFAKGDIGRTAYNAERLKLRSKLVGMNRNSVNLTMNEGKKLHSVVRQGGSIKGEVFKGQTQKLVKLQKLAKGGGVALSVVSLGVGCMEIADAKTSQEKNEIFVDTTVSVGAGILLGAVLVATPVGWGAAIVLGVGAAAASFGAGKGARALYRHKGKDLKIAETIGVTNVCRK